MPGSLSCWDVSSDKSCFSPRDMPGVADRGHLYSSNAKLWAPASSTPAYASKTRARIPWRPLEGTRTSEPSSRKYHGERLPSQAKELEGGRKWHLSAYKLIYRASLIIASLMFIIVVEPIFTLWHYHNSIHEVKQINWTILTSECHWLGNSYMLNPCKKWCEL